jgi:hypothetical protein
MLVLYPVLLTPLIAMSLLLPRQGSLARTRVWMTMS